MNLSSMALSSTVSSNVVQTTKSNRSRVRPGFGEGVNVYTGNDYVMCPPCDLSRFVIPK
jgi:hypothetical protein